MAGKDLLERVGAATAAPVRRGRQREVELAPEPLPPGWHVIGRHRFYATGRPIDPRTLRPWEEPWT
jgi:hypothetical protein